MKKIILCAVILLSGLGANAQTKSVTLQEGTVVKVAINDDISGKEVQVGTKVNFTTTEDIIQGNTVVVASAILLSPLALFVKGKNAKYKEGDVFDAYVDETVVIE